MFNTYISKELTYTEMRDETICCHIGSFLSRITLKDR